jgi:hypothetical protein
MKKSKGLGGWWAERTPAGRRQSWAAEEDDGLRVRGIGVGEASMGTRPRGMAGEAAESTVGMVSGRNGGRRWRRLPW